VDGLSVELFGKEGGISCFVFLILIKLSTLCDSLAGVPSFLAVVTDHCLLVSLKEVKTDAAVAILVRLSCLLVNTLTDEAVVDAIVIIIEADSNVGITG
jgi:hypothetical protein